MTSARYVSDGCRVLTTTQVRDVHRRALICLYCNARVTYVDTYTICESKRIIRSFFRLGRNQVHEINCVNRVDRQVSIAAARSQRIENGNPSIVRNGGVFSLRLNFVDEANRVASQLNDCTNDEERKEVYRSHEYISDGRILNSYFRSALGVACIRANAFDKKEMEEILTITFRKQQLSWSDFFYDISEYTKLRLHLLKDVGPRHPVAVVVIPEKVNQRNERWEFVCASSLDHRSENSKYTKDLVPYLSFSDEILANSIERKRQYIVLGYPEFWPKSETKLRNKGVMKSRVYFNVVHRLQIAKNELDSDEIGAIDDGVG